MGMNIVEKILKAHLVDGEFSVGNEIGIRIDQTLTQDATGTMAYLQFEAMGLDSIKTELAVSYVDHNTIQVGFENADDHVYLRTAAAKYGAVFSRPGNGICHQLHLERFGKPGKTLLGSDSHTPTGGGIGMLAIGAGGLDVAVAMGAGPFYLNVPKVIKIELNGAFKPWVSAKDVILKVLETFSTKGNVGCVFEYSGTALKNLDIPSRATITNMGAECGVTTSVFPSDEITKAFMELQGRGDDWSEVKADADADYYRVVSIDLSELRPMAATPHSPGNISSVESLAGKRVNQVLIGSCTNSSYRDLKMVAKILKGKKIHPEVELGIAPGSRQVVQMLAKEGALADIIASGARLLENACGFCIGNSMSPVSGGVSLRTSNRNFEGRSGTPSAGLYLVSPEVAAVSALYGKIVDPSLVDDLSCPEVELPENFIIDDSMFVYPEENADVEVVKGSNIGEVPLNSELQNVIKGDVVIKVGDKITTDHIMPAGQRLKFRSNIEKYSQFVFEGMDPDFSSRAGKNRDNGISNIIVAGESYGQGSSREHAALCPMYLGLKAVVAKSIERIHMANLINVGIVPLIFENDEDYEKINQGASVSIEGLKGAIDGTAPAELHVEDKVIPLKLDISERQGKILLCGGMLQYSQTFKL